MNRMKFCILVTAMVLFMQQGYSQGSNPDIAIRLVALTDTNCLRAGEYVYQEVIVTNIGDTDVYDIPLRLDVSVCQGWIVCFLDTLKGVLQAGTLQNFTFSDSFTVPTDSCFCVRASAELDCDTNQKDNVDRYCRCVDLDDIEIVRILKPDGIYDRMDDVIYPEVSIRNWSLNKTFDTVIVNAVISDGGYTPPMILTDTLTNFAPDTTLNHIFTSPYTVPYVSQYAIMFFVNSVDDYPQNDTIVIWRTTSLCSGITNQNANGFSLSQNIPNPTKGNTRIEYNLLQDGEVIFTVYSITGQTLYVEKKDSYSGKNNIEFSTANLTNGIYYYSMEYGGERLVKRMTVRR